MREPLDVYDPAQEDAWHTVQVLFKAVDYARSVQVEIPGGGTGWEIMDAAVDVAIVKLIEDYGGILVHPRTGDRLHLGDQEVDPEDLVVGVVIVD